MKILIVGATPVHLAAATRLRRLDETAKITVIDEAGESPDISALRRRYCIDLRSFTRFISADMGYASMATLEDVLTRHIYQEEFDKIVNTVVDDSPATFHYLDNDILVHILHNHSEIAPQQPGNAIIEGRRIAGEIYNQTAQVQMPTKLQIADVAGLKLAILGQTERSLNASQMPHIYSILPISGGFCKLIYDDAGNILGFVMLGESSAVCNCADVMATLVNMGGNIHNMVALKLSDAANPLPTLGKIAQNVIEKRLHMAYADEIAQLLTYETILLDVRHQLEFMDWRIEGSINVPLEALRESIYRLERTKEIIVICTDGKDSYLAARILMAHGFKTRHLTGGLVYARPIIGGQNA